MTNEDLQDKEPRSSTEIESDIRQTRGRMDATLDELSDRMTARSLLNSALDWWESRNPGTPPGRNATSDAYQTVARRVKENPLPSLFIGFGLVWMIIDATTKDDEEAPSVGKRRDFPYKGERPDGAARHPRMPSNTSRRKAKPGTPAAWLRARKTNSGKQNKQFRQLLRVLRKKWPLWVRSETKPPMISVDVHRMCMSKAARARRRLAATSSVATTQARNKWRTP